MKDITKDNFQNTISDDIPDTIPDTRPNTIAPIVNRVAESEINVFNLEDLWDGREIVEFDIEPFLYESLIVREKDYRIAVREQDWSAFADQHVAIHCSVDTIVPTWAFMLVASRLKPYAASAALGRRDDLLLAYYAAKLEDHDFSPYKDGIVVIKGCGTGNVPVEAYVDATCRLQAVARKIMYGEPCSSVPLWRRPKIADA